MWGESLPPANSGRDRAIETLIDMEPSGPFYRAARVLDEAVPFALSARPNLVTRAALVEQANSLSEHEIDSLEKYAKVFHSLHVKTLPQKTLENKKDYVLRHHAKILTIQRVHRSNGGETVSPPPQLVAALRRVYDGSSTTSTLRSLLRQVMDHKAFLKSEEEKNTSNATDRTESNDDEKSVEDTELFAANLESIVGNVCRVAVESSLGGNQDDNGEVLQGLLIAALSILTGSMLEGDHAPQEEGPRTKIVDGLKMATSGTTASSQVDSLKPIMPALQVGGVLSLLPSVDSTLEENNDEDHMKQFSLDSDILSYLGSAAAVYEERIEIQKARVLARLKAESEREAAAAAAKAAQEQADAEEKEEDGDAIVFAPVTPPSGNATAAGDVVSPDSNVAVIQDDEDEEAAIEQEEEEEAREAERNDRIAAQVSGDETSSAEDPDESGLPTLEAHESDSDEGDSTNSDNDNESHGSSSGWEDEAGEFEADNPQSAHLHHEHVDIHEEDDDDEMSSSSSSSSDDDNVVDEHEMLVDDDGAVGSDVDEEDDAMLRQALALSLAEHSSSFRNSETRGADQEDGADGDERDGSEENESDNESKPPPVLQQSGLGLTASDSTEMPPLVEADAKESAEDENDDSLPPLPAKPSYYPYQSLLLRRGGLDNADFAPFSSEEEVASEGAEEVSASYLEPAALSKFGTVPAAHVVVHMLQNAIVTVQSRQGYAQNESDGGDTAKESDGCSRSSIPGGIGCSLFVPQPLSYHLEASNSVDKGEFSSDDAVSFQLLVAAFLLFSECRKDAIESLRQAILLEHQNAGDRDIEEELKEEEEDGVSTPTSDEEDDPALALAMNYASSPSHASSSISESLETKGMKRKAAAAAHDAALLLKSLRKRTEAWKQRVQFYSHCTFMVMRCLRMYLQSVTRYWLKTRSLPERDQRCQSLVECAEFLPSTTRSKLSDSLTLLMSVNTFRSFSTLFDHDDSDQVEELLLPLKLYREAVMTWGECVPLLYPSPAARTTILSTLINDSSQFSGEESGVPEALDGLKSLPSSEWQTHLHRLRLLCQRLRVSDLLDAFVSHPISYDPSDSSETHEIVKLRDEGGKTITEDPERASSLVSLVGSACEKLRLGEDSELRELYLALCHKCNVRTLLWDGFLACSTDDSDDSLTPTSASPSLASSDILGVAANPSTTLQFDASKCSDSIAILSSHRNASSSTNGSSVHQRASKVWGAVLSSSYFSPRTGIHRWAIRLDRCERGHVFVGVSTSQASMRTYVGGDKYGWGVIGTQALWHDRRKIRGDYGATFRTGSCIIVTLDTDAGTLSFSSWKDSNSATAAFSLDALLPSLASPSQSSRRHATGGGGIVEDWGVAFEGLPLDSRLYPAVGLYQRDDRVTLLNVESGGRSSLQDGVDGFVSGGACYFPRNLKSVGGGIDGVSHHRRIVHVRRHNDLLSWDGVQYVTDILHRVCQSAHSPHGPDKDLLTSVLPSIAASICLVPPSIPVLSARSALSLLPQLNGCIRVLDELLVTENKHKNQLFPGSLMDGKWIIRATGSSGTLAGSECEEYVVNLGRTVDSEGSLIGFQGTGVGTTGKSKNGLVSIMGAVRGSAISFVEEWTDGSDVTSAPEDSSSSCVIAARLSLDGSKFEGSYRNVQYGTTGHIAGMLCRENRTASKPHTEVAVVTHAIQDPLVACEALLCLAHGHLAGLLGADAPGDHSNGMEASRPDSYSVSEWKRKCGLLKGCLLRPLLSGGLQNPDSYDIVDSLREFYSFPLHGGASISRGDYRALDTLDAMLSSVPVGQGPESNVPTLEQGVVAAIDEALRMQTGGNGSLCSICPVEYTDARHLVICILAKHSGLSERLLQFSSDDNSVYESLDDDILDLWRVALRIMEDGVRKALSLSDSLGRTKREVAIDRCEMTNHISWFLITFQNRSDDLSVSGVIDELSSFYSIIESQDDLDYLESEIERATKRSVLRAISLQQMVSLLSRKETSPGIKAAVGVECCTLVLPRLLGRGLAEVATKTSASNDVDDWSRLCNDDLGGYYLTQLSASGQISEFVRETVHKLFQALGELLANSLREGQEETSSDSHPPSGSLLLALLASFTMTIRDSDVDEIMLKSGILNRLPEILSQHREAIHAKNSAADLECESDEIAVVRKIHETVSRDISRALIRASVSVVHVTCFQLARQASLPSRAGNHSFDAIETALQLCVDLLHGELVQTLPSVREIMSEEFKRYRQKLAAEQLKKWCEISIPSEDGRATKSKGSSKLRTEGNAGLIYLIKQGTLQSPAGVTASSQRLSTRPTTPVPPGNTGHSDQFLILLGAPCHQHVSQLLNILSSMVKFPASLSLLSRGRGWMEVLLQTVGLDCVFDIADGSLNDVSLRQDEEISRIPLRYRMRTLRLLLFLLSKIEPSQKLVESLFLLAGSSNSIVANNMDDDENSVSREVVSLLRRLYSVPNGRWRECIGRFLNVGLERKMEEADSPPVLQLGVLAFFSGFVGRICRGSYVLLKPAAAAPLSSDLQSSSSSKSHGTSGGSGTSSGAGVSPHHVVGNGTEGVIAGLCRADALAGIVSSVDVKSCTCEVVLTSRHMDSSFGANRLSQAPLRARSTETADRGVSGTRFTMTVRALRAPLSDVVNAEEVPLLLGTSPSASANLGSVLSSSLSLLAAALSEAAVPHDPEKQNENKPEHELDEDSQTHAAESSKQTFSHDRSQAVGLSLSLMALRSTTTILSDERLLSNFMEAPSSRQNLANLLELASFDKAEKTSLPQFVDSARVESLSSLPTHEARFCHLLSMLREIDFRKQLLDSAPMSYWEEQISERIPENRENDAVKEKPSSDAGAPNVAEGYSTPPATSGSISGGPPALTTSNAVDDDDSGSNVRNASSSQIGVPRSSGRSNVAEEEEEDADETAAAHLREAAIAQMAELGLPRPWSEYALRRTGGTNIEAAVHFCLERGGDMDRLLAEERERERMMQRQNSASGGSRRRGNRESSNHLLRQLLEMGFPSRWCAEALAATRNNVDEALTWILTNGERLSAEDEGMDDDDDEEEEEDAESESGDEESGDDEAGDSGVAAADADQGSIEGTEGANSEAQTSSTQTQSHTEGATQENKSLEAKADSERSEDAPVGWSGSVTPLRFISGRSIINPKTLEVSGLPTGGFSSVGTKGVMLTSGKWYYEAILESAGCLQIGWADGSFSGHCHADRGDGCGDGPSSWAYDGWRRYRWHACATEWGCRWKEGDVVGCLVDMDEHVVSFTLNGRGEEIGMGVAFTGKGFRPCGGVYACVSFNRREKLRLILGGKGSEQFKHPPPPGYRGVGDAVLESVDELDVILQKETLLDPLSSLRDKEPESKKFLCDFSDGEHGHELFAWQHRYYGSDASVHLGSGRSSKQSSSSHKHSAGAGANVDSPAAVYVSRRVEKLWSAIKGDLDLASDAESSIDAPSVITKIKQGYDDAAQQISSELWDECVALGVLYSRRIILHLIATMGSSFDISCFIPRENRIKVERGIGEDEEVRVARQIWRVLDVCVSLRSVGWVGEAGAMAVAAEALGLGISSNDHRSHFRHHSSERGGGSSKSDAGDEAIRTGGGISQLLSTTLISDVMDHDVKDTARSFAACAEAAIGGGGGGGSLVFLQRGLQNAVRRSEALRRILIAVVRRSVRLLAAVDYAGNDSATSEILEDEDLDSPSGAFEKASRSQDIADEDGYKDGHMVPDARLACFLTGLLLSRPVQTALSESDAVMIPLFEAWSVGLLSASPPWRMVCALTTSGILNECPLALPKAMETLPTLAHVFGRLESTVVRRVWAERAAAPVCSRFVQSMIELLASVKRAIHTVPPASPLFEIRRSVAVDAATPLPLEMPSSPLTPKQNKSDTPTETLPTSWEWEEGWVASDAGWELWSGTIESMAVDWKTPSRSAVRTLMDGGEGPPMLREGCYVMRGLDWGEAGSGSKTGKEDGKDIYEEGKARREEEKRALEEEEKAAQEDPAVCGTSETEVANDADPGDEANDPVIGDSADRSDSPKLSSAASDKEAVVGTETAKQSSPGKKKKKGKKIPSPKLPIGTVLSIESWNGIPAMARRVRWHLTGIEGVYRYGGQGGRYDISHVEVNDKSTRVRKRHPLPESAEQCASRHGFGASRKYSVLLRLRRHGSPKNVDGEVEFYHQGILEWPDFGAGIRVDCILHSDGAVSITERELLYGSKDSGWEARFGQPSYEPGTVIVLNPIGSSTLANQADLDVRSSSLSFYEELLGSTSFTVETLRNRADGSKLRVTSEMKLLRARRTGSVSPKPSTPMSAPVQAPLPPPICFDHDFKASSLSLSRDGRTVSCIAPDGRSTAFASVGFTKGVHYWEVKLEQADIGSVFIGVAEKPSGSMSSGGSSLGEVQPRLNRWHGWGFVNFRATYNAGAERVYGAHCHNSDTVGVLLDCDAGRVSFFCDHLKYGEHILNDLGCAFENLSPFGFNADGCGNGGAGQGAPSGVEGGRGGRYPAQGSVRPRALWPVVGLRTPGDRVTISSKWMSSYGIDGVQVLKNVLAVDEMLCRYDDSRKNRVTSKPPEFILEGDQSSKEPDVLPKWLVEEAFTEYEHWRDGRWYRSRTRGSGPHQLASFGLDVDLDTSLHACACASAAVGSKFALLSGDRVVVKRSAGRMLELAEEAVVLGAYQGRLFYRIVAQKSEGGSLTEGGGRAWFWDESEVVDNSLQLIGTGKGLGVTLPLLDRFRCTAAGGLKIVYEGGAVVRSDLEIFDGSQTVGSIPFGTVIPQKDVLERRVNSCNVVRYRVRVEDLKLEGWISSRIRGGREESIVMPMRSDDVSEEQPENRYQIPLESATAWYEEYQNELSRHSEQEHADTLSDGLSEWAMKDFHEFEELVSQGTIAGLSPKSSDELVTSAVDAIADFTEGGDAVDCSFKDIVKALSFAVATHRGERRGGTGVPGANQAAAAVFSTLTVQLPSTKALLARIAVLRAINRRARFALPWLSIRPSQEGSAIFGGLCGHGASIERAGRNMNSKAMELWFQPSSIASRVRCCRNLLFRSVKRLLLESITEATTTPTPLSHDEYELPREIRTVRINRLKAIRAMAGDDNGAKRKYSVFSQLHNETRSWGGAALRRGFVAKGHGGQKRAFKVKLIGEGVNDYSGPYRETFTDAAQEVTAVDSAGHGALGVLEPTPNNSSDVGDNRELFMFSTGDRGVVGYQGSHKNVSVEEARIRECFASLMTARDESSREVEEALMFLGRMSGTACRHGIPVDLPLPLNSVWKALVEETSDYSERLQELDLMAFRQLGDSAGSTIPPLLWWQQRMLNSFVEGMSNVLPVEIFPLFTGEELRDILCGNPDVDVDLLRQVVEYEGYDENDDVVKYFWEALREMSNKERKLFLQFVWARSRLPMKESDFDAPFKIQKDTVNSGMDADVALPSASTCFFSLTLPKYSSKQVLKEKLLFAIENVCTMESDYVTNDAEVGEGWRGL